MRKTMNNAKNNIAANNIAANNIAANNFATSSIATSLIRTMKTRKRATIKNRTLNIRTHLRCERGEFGMSAIIGIAIGLIIAAFILIPGLQTFATTIMTDMELWWTNSISSQIFPN